MFLVFDSKANEEFFMIYIVNTINYYTNILTIYYITIMM